MPAANPVFDRLFDAAVPALLAGEHRVDVPPLDGGRWPVSVVAVPSTPVREALAALMRDALTYAGPGHFETGAVTASHLTVRALETYREAASPTEEITAAWRAALDRTARDHAPIRLRLTGVTLTQSGVMVQAEPVDERPWELMRGLGEALGPLAWLEGQGLPRDIWYSTILHFAGPIRDAPGLIEWVREHRTSLDLDITLDALTLTRYRYRATTTQRLMAMEPWHTAPLTGDQLATNVP